MKLPEYNKEINYTKGEWTIYQGAERPSIYIPNNKNGGALIAEMGLCVEKDANAHLIAAAPDMYQACKKALLLLEWITTGDFSRGKDKPVRELLAKVISKAEGK